MENLNALFASIARKHLRIETLETRNSDQLDFPEVAVWEVRRALDAAFKAGYERGLEAQQQEPAQP
ncbi:DUF6900 domain-containing protein [Caldimonas brevitalea]|uniref:DUF6900 domain-containing protein n=1 Tax=Caldimonas brevitalea TaxID=413882 RepID=A0A0G3BMJ7_9BURK|nr:hypothetical protein [Caldimonas brevitalea]AKJ30669.1 hypothetical protein AAW51_3978 [Caldimonas brevitalea]